MPASGGWQSDGDEIRIHHVVVALDEAVQRCHSPILPRFTQVVRHAGQIVAIRQTLIPACGTRDPGLLNFCFIYLYL